MADYSYDRRTAGVQFWVTQLKALDRALPRYNPKVVTDWNKVMKHYRAEGLSSRDSGTPAHYYQEYRAGTMTLEQAAKQITKELPKAERVLGPPA